MGEHDRMYRILGQDGTTLFRSASPFHEAKVEAEARALMVREKMEVRVQRFDAETRDWRQTIVFRPA